MKTPTLRELALGFTYLSLTGFGGVAPQARFYIVTRRQWLSEREFGDMFALGQILPGANVANLAVMLGDRTAGPFGAFVTLCALCLPPLALTIGLAVGAMRLTEVFPRFTAAEAAITATAAALIGGNGIRLVVRLLRGSDGGAKVSVRAERLLLTLATVVLIAGFHLWLPIAVAVMLSISIAIEARRAR